MLAYIPSPEATANNLYPFALDVTFRQSLSGALVTLQVEPLSIDIYMCPIIPAFELVG